MDMNLLKNKIVYITSVLVSISFILGAVLWYMVDKADYHSYIWDTRHISLWMLSSAYVGFAIIYSLVLQISLFTYIFSYFSFSTITFRVNQLIFGPLGDNEFQRTMMHIIGIVLAIIWVQIAKKIREKV